MMNVKKSLKRVILIALVAAIILGAVGCTADSVKITNHETILYNSANETISAGQDHSLAIKVDGSLWAWGSNDSGQLRLLQNN